ncbi:MAG: transporter substrate-binding domain-containing protein, partial [Lachnospiraceae bacterium]|nr:transporter substrate-binding domain-containing protein [Lachnospiraceae bacterium]
ERADQMLFSELPMGSEEYTIFTTPDNREIQPSDYSTFNGKKIGVNKGSLQAELFRQWAKQHDVHAELIELTIDEVNSVKMLEAGEIDAYITLNAYGDPDRLMPVCEIGSSDFYFAVNKERPDLVSDLNKAMYRIRSENPYYNQRMYERYMQRYGTNAFLSAEEEA